MTEQTKKTILSQGLLLLGFALLFLIGFISRKPVIREVFTVIGLYGYPAFLLIRYVLRTAKIFRRLDARKQRKRITIILLSVVGLYLLFFIHNYAKTEFLEYQAFEKDAAATGEQDSDFLAQAEVSNNVGCTITATVLSVETKRYDDVVILRRKHHRRGVTKIFLQLEIVRVEGITSTMERSDISRRMCQVGNTVNAYAYKETDIVGTQPIRKFQQIKCEIMAVPLSAEGFYYKVERIRRR